MRKIFTIINRGYISHRHLLGRYDRDYHVWHKQCQDYQNLYDRCG